MSRRHSIQNKHLLEARFRKDIDANFICQHSGWDRIRAKEAAAEAPAPPSPVRVYQQLCDDCCRCLHEVSVVIGDDFGKCLGYQTRLRHSEWSEVITRATSQELGVHCLICHQFAAQFDEAIIEEQVPYGKVGLRDDRPTFWTVESRPEFGKGIRIIFYAPGVDRERHHFELFCGPLLSRVDPPAFPMLDDQGESQEALADSQVESVKSWMKTCFDAHEQCGDCLSGTSGFLPERLIEVRDGGAIISLKERDHMKPGTEYVTLSHRWGELPDRFDLLSSNIDEFRTGVAVDRLPKTFRNAIKTASQLDVRYLWIDALCILQDSTEDWQTQCAMMSETYGSAIFNIAAISAADDAQGFLSRPRSGLEKGFQFDLNHLMSRYEPEPKPSALRRQHRDYLERFSRLCQGPTVLKWSASNRHGQFSQSTSQEPDHLSRRAWMHQERALARRTLGFYRGSALWTCGEYTGSIFTGRDTPYHITSRWMRSVTGIGGVRDWLRKAREKPESVATVVQFWCRQVELYSALAITNRTDKLMAISGLAKAVRSVTNADYLAGLWRTELPFQLCWSRNIRETVTSGSVAFSPESYIAPSWSWASIDQAVSWPRLSVQNGYSSLAEVKEIDVILVSPMDPYGQVRAGTLNLHGRSHSVVDMTRDSSIKLVCNEDLRLDFAPDSHSFPSPFDPLAKELRCIGLLLSFAAIPDTVLTYHTLVVHGPNREGRYRRIGAANFSIKARELSSNSFVRSLGTFPESFTKTFFDQQYPYSRVSHKDLDIVNEAAAEFEPSPSGREEFALI